MCVEECDIDCSCVFKESLSDEDEGLMEGAQLPLLYPIILSQLSSMIHRIENL